MAKSQAKKPAPAKKTAVKSKQKPAAKAPAKKPAATLARKASTAAKAVSKAKPAAKAKTKAVPVKKAAPAAKAKPVAKAKKAVAPKAAKPAAPVKVSKPISTKPKRNYKPAKLPAGYKPTASEPYMNAQQEEYFRQKLLSWRKELMEESRETLDHLHEENWHQADIADRAALETEAGVELRTRNRYLKLVSKIDAAIRRIEDGEYGYCEDSGEPIGLKRLEARPVATLSIEAQERHEKNERQYTDED